jgi:hypothetical protein
MDFIQQYCYDRDFAIGAAVPLGVTVLYAAKRISAFTWKLFWIGVAIGLTWEVPLSTLDGLGIVDIFSFAIPPPAHFIVIIISHTFWDGGLFLAGVLLVNLLCSAPHFASFSARELVLLLAWGQAQELGVELLSTGSGGWAYNPSWWNPSLFMFNGQHITLAPQLIWLAAPVVFYFAALAVKRDEKK